jgi:hypothetical protein
MGCKRLGLDGEQQAGAGAGHAGLQEDRGCGGADHARLQEDQWPGVRDPVTGRGCRGPVVGQRRACRRGQRPGDALRARRRAQAEVGRRHVRATACRGSTGGRAARTGGGRVA